MRSEFRIGKRKPPPTIGEVFGEWVVIGPTNGRKVLCECSCGHIHEIDTYTIRTGDSTQCRSCSNRVYSWDHKKYPRKIRDAVLNAMYRCTDDSHPRYKDWGGRGISVYPAWLENMSLFAEYLDALPGSTNSDRVLDRINNDGNYEPGNLRWATYSESSRNQRGRT